MCFDVEFTGVDVRIDNGIRGVFSLILEFE